MINMHKFQKMLISQLICFIKIFIKSHKLGLGKLDSRNNFINLGANQINFPYKTIYFKPYPEKK